MITHSTMGKAGRFANQLFQIAAVVGSAHKNGDNYCLPKWEYSHLFRGPFNEVNVLPRFQQEIRERGDFFPIDIKYNRRNSVNLKGYFQSEEYFKHCPLVIKDMFSFKVPEKSFGEHDSCSLHFRHGDAYDYKEGSTYIMNQDRHPIMKPEYYFNAVQHMRSKGIKKFFLFYDHENTKHWIEENIKPGPDMFFVDGQTPIDDFSTMKNCTHQIICNSTFSWWAAWLNPNPNKIIISPSFKSWYGSSYSYTNMSRIVPKEWHQI